ncbi:MAG TPA: hypothetical protein VFA64_16650 [Hyphomicrobiaceae bacterium]|nr:hypothetical protein [Hyphomicrobiaceae bacterium]
MTAAAIARYLPEFEAGEPRVARGWPDPALQSKTAARDAAFQEGVASGRAAAEAELADRLAQEKARLERELTAARAAWTQEESAKLAAQLVAGLDGIEARLAETVARLLEPFLAEQVRRRVVADLAETLNVLLAREPALAVSVRGAADLIEALRGHLAGELEHISFHPGPASELSVTAGQTLIETRLGAWVSAIKEAAA